MRNDFIRNLEQFNSLKSVQRQIRGNQQLKIQHCAVQFWCLPLNVASVNLQEQESAQASEQHCVQLEKARRELERQLSSLSERLQEEEACSTQLAIHRDRLEAECSSLRRDLDELESALTASEHDRQVDHYHYISSQQEKPIMWSL